MNTNNSENQETIIVSNLSGNDIAYQQDKINIDSQIATAKAYPRDILRATNNSVAIATMDKDIAASCTYSVPRGGKAITGPSVHLAKIIAQQWGNMRVEVKVIGVDTKQVTSQAIAFDLENNLAIKVEVKKSIMTKAGRMNDDMIVVTGNAANSIALRNAVFSVIPKSVTEKVYKSAMALLTGDISDKEKFQNRLKKVFDGFKNTYSLEQEDVLVAVGKTNSDQVTPDDLVVLIGIAQALKDGDTTVDEAFKNRKKSTEEKKKDVDAKKETITTSLSQEKQSKINLP